MPAARLLVICGFDDWRFSGAPITSSLTTRPQLTSTSVTVEEISRFLGALGEPAAKVTTFIEVDSVKRQRIRRASNAGLLPCPILAVVLLATGSWTASADPAVGLHTKLLAGEKVRFAGTEPDAERTIEAAWIEEAVSRSMLIDVSRAIIRGPLSLKGMVVERPFALTWCKTDSQADFSQTTFKEKLELSSAFQSEANFERATFEHDAQLSGAQFLSAAKFAGAHTHGAFVAQKTTFSKPFLDEPASFEGSIFDKLLSFRDAKFENDADFDNIQVLSTCDFSGVTFQRGASFIGAKFGGAALFSGYSVQTRLGLKGHPMKFGGNSNFTGAQFGGSAEFRNAEFNGRATFRIAHFDSAADAANFIGDLFADLADFSGVQIESTVNFANSKFRRGGEFRRSEDGGQCRILECCV